MSINNYIFITIPFSHYNEKARWGLDYFAVSYKEKRYLPILHQRPVKKYLPHGDIKDKHSSAYSTPVLVTPNKQVLNDSTQILQYLSEQFPEKTLYTQADCLELEEYFDNELGPHTRTLAYYYLQQDMGLFMKIMSNNVGFWQRNLYKMIKHKYNEKFKKIINITPEKKQRAEEKIKDCFAKVSEMLNDGRKYLVTDKFTAADLAFSALAAPVLLINQDDNYGAWLGAFSDYPKPFQDFANELRATRAGQFALRQYQENRQRC